MVINKDNLKKSTKWELYRDLERLRQIRKRFILNGTIYSHTSTLMNKEINRLNYLENELSNLKSSKMNDEELYRYTLRRIVDEIECLNSSIKNRGHLLKLTNERNEKHNEKISILENQLEKVRVVEKEMNKRWRMRLLVRYVKPFLNTLFPSMRFVFKNKHELSTDLIK